MSYDPDTGAELWSCGGNTFEVIPTPVVGHGLIFCSSGRAGPTLAIRPGGTGDVTKTHVEWTSPRGSPFVPSPLLYGDSLYLVNDMTAIATSFRAATGEVMWQGRLGVARREGFSASPVGVDGKVFFTNDDGETFVVRAGPTFELIHENRLGAQVLASPALVDRTWYFRTSRELLAIGEPGRGKGDGGSGMGGPEGGRVNRRAGFVVLSRATRARVFSEESAWPRRPSERRRLPGNRTRPS